MVDMDNYISINIIENDKGYKVHVPREYKSHILNADISSIVVNGLNSLCASSTTLSCLGVDCKFCILSTSEAHSPNSVRVAALFKFRGSE